VIGSSCADYVVSVGLSALLFQVPATFPYISNLLYRQFVTRIVQSFSLD